MALGGIFEAWKKLSHFDETTQYFTGISADKALYDMLVELVLEILLRKPISSFLRKTDKIHPRGNIVLGSLLAFKL